MHTSALKYIGSGLLIYLLSPLVVLYGGLTLITHGGPQLFQWMAEVNAKVVAAPKKAMGSIQEEQRTEVVTPPSLPTSKEKPAADRSFPSHPAVAPPVIRIDLTDLYFTSVIFFTAEKVSSPFPSRTSIRYRYNPEPVGWPPAFRPSQATV
jgi:hypothetical protein